MMRPSDDVLRRLGESLREIDPKTLNHDPAEGPVRWFLGEAGTEITAWVDDARAPHHVQLIFSRVSIEWSDKGLTTGAFDSKSTTAGGRYDPYLLRVGGAADPQVCEAALLLLAASDIDVRVKRPLEEALRAALAASSSPGIAKPDASPDGEPEAG